MRHLPALLAAVTFALALLAGLQAWQVLLAPAPVLQVQVDLPAGAALQPEHVRVVYIPAKGRPAAAVAAPADLAGYHAATPLVAGQWLLEGHLSVEPPPSPAERLAAYRLGLPASAGGGGLALPGAPITDATPLRLAMGGDAPATLTGAGPSAVQRPTADPALWPEPRAKPAPEPLRVISLPIQAARAPTGNLQPGQRVDVLAAYPPRPGAPTRAPEVLLESVAVFEAGETAVLLWVTTSEAVVAAAAVEAGAAVYLLLVPAEEGA